MNFQRFLPPDFDYDGFLRFVSVSQPLELFELGQSKYPWKRLGYGTAEAEPKIEVAPIDYEECWAKQFAEHQAKQGFLS